MDNDTHDETPDRDRPLGYWLRVVDALLDRAFAEAFAETGADRRDWMLLNVVDGDIRIPWALGRGGKRLRRLEERGWITSEDGSWSLTDEGRAAKQRLADIVESIRTRVSSAVGDEQFASTMASLEAIARELGWQEPGEGEASRMPFGRFGRFGPRGGFAPFGPGFGPGFGRGFGRGPHGFGPAAPQFGPDHGECEHGHGHRGHGRRGHEHEGHGHGRDRATESAYERGFAAGFAQGRSAQGRPTDDAAGRDAA